MSKTNSVASRYAGSPVASLGPTSDFYYDKAQGYANGCATAMRAGDLHLANELYERGINAMMNHRWHSALANMVGGDFTQIVHPGARKSK